MNRSGEALRRARVSLQSVGSEYSVVRFETDANGNFGFPNLAPGRYWLITTHNGYLRFSSPTPLTVSAGQQITGLQVKLTRESIVSGTVVDGGEPVPTARVNLLNEKMDQLSSTPVRPDGSFVIGDARAGNYYLSADDMPQLPIGTRPISGPRDGYIETYYPGVTDPAKAALIRVEAGAQIHDLNFRIARSAVLRIRGRVVDGDGAPVSEANLELIEVDSTSIAARLLRWTGVSSSGRRRRETTCLRQLTGKRHRRSRPDTNGSVSAPTTLRTSWFT